MNACCSRILVGGITGLALFVGGCQSTGGPKQTTGAVGGAIAGGLVGSQVGGGSGRLLAIAAGALLGAWAGSEIGRQLDENDRLAMEQASQRALATDISQRWSNPDSGANGQVTVTSTTRESRSRPLPVLKARVDQLPPMELIGEAYAPSVTTNVRSGPGTAYRVVGQLPRGEPTHVVGRVEGAPWYLVSQNGTGIGFVSASLLQPTSAKPLMKAVDEKDVERQTVEVTETCKSAVQNVTLRDGMTHSEEITACKQPDGSWKIS